MNPAELERLAILSEELGEVQQVIGKILRFGYDSYNPLEENGKTNRERLEIEVGDLLCILNIMWDENSDLDALHIDEFSLLKREKLNKWMKHNKLEV